MALSALALLLVLVGALGAALVVYRSGHRSDVLVAAHEIKPGQRVTATDFTTARVSTDGGQTVPAANRGAFVGTYAIADVPAGTLINHLMFQATNVLPPDGVVIGASVASTQRPAAQLQVGDVVRAFYDPKQTSTSSSALAGPVLTSAARIVAVATPAGNSDIEVVSLLVTEPEANAIAHASSANAVALGLLPPGTKPELELQIAS